MLSIDDSLQKRFHKLVDITTKLCTPATPGGNNGRFETGAQSLLRRTAINNNKMHDSASNDTPRRSFGEPSLPTVSGICLVQPCQGVD